MNDQRVLQLLDNALDYCGDVITDSEADIADVALALETLDTAWTLAQHIRSPHIDPPITAEQITDVMDQYLQKAAQVFPPTPMPTAMDHQPNLINADPPMPTVAHLGEIVHLQLNATHGCYPAIVVNPGRTPMLTAFTPNPGSYKDIPHWETPELYHYQVRWHCACECAQATGTTV